MVDPEEQKAAGITDLRAQRTATKASMTRIKNIVEQKATTITATELQCRLGIFEAYFKQFLSYQSAIERCTPSDADHQIQRDDVEELYCSTKSRILGMLSERRNSITAAEHSYVLGSAAPTNNLLKVKLPQFSGKYSDFPMFIKTFDVLVHKEANL